MTTGQESIAGGEPGTQPTTSAAGRLSPAMLRAATVIAVVALGPAIIAGVVFGVEVAAGVAIGLGVGLSAGVVVAVPTAIGLGVLNVAVAAIATAVGPVAGPAALVVGGAGLLLGPANERGIGRAILLLPMVAALGTSGVLGNDLGRGLGGLVAGIGWGILLATRLPTPRTPQPLSRSGAWTHAVALALTCGLATWVALTVPLPHGYWIVVTLCAVLVPSADETVRVTAERVAGTIAGAVVGVIAGVVLPPALLGLAVFLSVVMLIAYALSGDGRRKVLWLTVMTVLLVGGLAGSGTVSVAVERFAWTLAAALLVGAVGLAVAILDRRFALRAGTQAPT